MNDQPVRFWTDDEPGWATATQEIARIKRRVRARFWFVLILALVLTAAAVFKQSRKKRLFEATVVMRVTEGSFDPKSAPPTAAKLQDYLWDVSFSRKNLEKLIVKHGLYKSLYHIDPGLAVEEFRDVLDIKVVRNYFAKERYPDDPPRSARLAISYSYTSPRTAIVIARELAHLAEKQNERSRRFVSSVAAASAQQSTTAISRRLEQTKKQLAELKVRYIKAPLEQRARIIVKAHSLMSLIETLDNQLHVVGSRKTEFDLRRDLEDRDLGLRFEIVDPGREPKVLITDTTRLIILGIISFFFIFPVVGIGVGAYDLRIYDLEDIERIGLRPFGHVPAFAGYDSGSLEQRLNEP